MRDSGADLAERTGKSWQAVHAWCTEASVPKAASLKRISDVTGVSMRWLESNEGPPVLEQDTMGVSPPGYYEFVEHFGKHFDEALVAKMGGEFYGRFGLTAEEMTAKRYLELAQWIERARGQ